MAEVAEHKGRLPINENVYFRALPKLALPPPSPQFGQLGPPFSDVKNDVLRVWQKKNTDDDDDGWNDNYDGDDDNVDEIDEKNYQNNIQMLWLILGPITLWKKGQKIRAGASPPWFGQCPKVNILFYGWSSLTP